MARRAPRWAWVLSLGLIGTIGCDDGVTPALSDFRFDGSAEDSALVLLLSVDFHDGDGDLSDGVLETFIDDRPTTAGALGLTALFLESGLALGVTDGTLEFVLELALDSSAVPGGTFRIGARATDGLQHSSSTQEITLKISE